MGPPFFWHFFICNIRLLSLKRETEKQRLMGKRWILDDNISLLFCILHATFPPKKIKSQLIHGGSYSSWHDLHLSMDVCLQEGWGGGIDVNLFWIKAEIIFSEAVFFCSAYSWPLTSTDAHSLADAWAGMTPSGTDLRKSITWGQRPFGALCHVPGDLQNPEAAW